MDAHTETGKRTLSQRWEVYQPPKSAFLWAFAVGVLAALIVGFGWGGWVTGGTSRALVSEASKKAHATLASAICVEKFTAAADSAAKLTELAAITNSFGRREFIEAGGWATMPGETEPDRAGAEGCAASLLKT